MLRRAVNVLYTGLVFIHNHISASVGPSVGLTISLGCQSIHKLEERKQEMRKGRDEESGDGGHADHRHSVFRRFDRSSRAGGEVRAVDGRKSKL